MSQYRESTGQEQRNFIVSHKTVHILQPVLAVAMARSWPEDFCAKVIRIVLLTNIFVLLPGYHPL